MPLLDSILLLDSDFQFSTKELQSTKKQEMCVLCDPFKAMCVCVCVYRYIYQQNYPGKRPDGGPSGHRPEHNHLKDAQKTKGKH